MHTCRTRGSHHRQPDSAVDPPRGRSRGRDHRSRYRYRRIRCQDRADGGGHQGRCRGQIHIRHYCWYRLQLGRCLRGLVLVLAAIVYVVCIVGDGLVVAVSHSESSC